MQKYQTQVLIVSNQMIPNVTPVLDEEIRPEKVILCASNKMKARADLLRDFFVDKKIAAEIFSLGDAYDFFELQERFLGLATRLESESSVAVNVTGGNKLMTLAAQMVFEDRPRFYVIPERDQIVMLSKSAQRYEIQDKLLLRDYFAIHGFRIQTQERKTRVADKTRTLCDSILEKSDAFQRQVGRLNALAAEAEDRGRLAVRDERGLDGMDELLNLFYRHGSISYYDDHKVEFTSEQARDFCKGFWLEDYVASEMQKVDEQVGLQDYASSIELLSSSGTKNEIDAAFLYNNELYVIECKTARMDQKGDAVLYKIDTIRGYGGLHTRSIVTSFRELRRTDKQRAEDLRIHLIEGKNLNRLAERIIEMIRPDKGEK